MGALKLFRDGPVLQSVLKRLKSDARLAVRTDIGDA